MADNIVMDFLGFLPEEHRYKLMEVSPDLMGNLFLNNRLTPDEKEIHALRVEGLPGDVRIQAFRYDAMRQVCQFRLWSSHWPVVDLYAEVPRVEVMIHGRVYEVTKEPEIVPGIGHTRGQATLKHGYEFL